MWKDKSALELIIIIGATVLLSLIIAWSQIRPLGYVFAGLTCHWICTALYPEFTIFMQEICYWDLLIKQRSEKPRMYFIILYTVLVSLAAIGNILSGSSIVIIILFCSVMFFFQNKITTDKNRTAILDAITNAAGTELIDIEDEFLFQQNEANHLLLKYAGEEALILNQMSTRDEEDEQNSDDAPFGLAIPESIPEIDEHTDNSDTENDVFLGLQVNKNEIRNESRKSISSTISDEMQLKCDHINRETGSSSDEESIISGLSFQHVNLMDYNNTNRTNNSLFAFPNMIQYLVTTKIEQFVQDQIQGSFEPTIFDKNSIAVVDSSDENEFEILNHDELKEIA